MLTFLQTQDAILERFNSGRRSDCKEWIRFANAQLWELEDWPFKQAAAAVTVTTGSTAVTGVPANLGVVHALQRYDGSKLRYMPWRSFELEHFGDTSTSQPYDYTIIGTGASAQLVVGPPSSETSSAYQLLHTQELGYYPSTTLTAGATLPTGTLTVASTAAAPSSGTLLVGGRLVAYTGKTGTTFTGCTGGTGTFSSGDLVVVMSAQAGNLFNDSDVSLLPGDFHQILVHAGMAIGQSAENDYSIYLSDDRVQQALDAMRRRYLTQALDEVEQWGSYEHAVRWGW